MLILMELRNSHGQIHLLDSAQNNVQKDHLQTTLQYHVQVSVERVHLVRIQHGDAFTTAQ